MGRLPLETKEAAWEMYRDGKSVRDTSVALGILLPTIRCWAWSQEWGRHKENGTKPKLCKPRRGGRKPTPRPKPLSFKDLSEERKQKAWAWLGRVTASAGRDAGIELMQHSRMMEKARRV